MKLQLTLFHEGHLLYVYRADAVSSGIFLQGKKIISFILCFLLGTWTIKAIHEIIPEK